LDVGRRASRTRPRRLLLDALVVAIAEPGGTVLARERADIAALAAHVDRASVDVI